ncbi:MAG: hypothetical protein DRP84_08085 [Spirochaetes bacterium]|nr:MAG: hypothetical protein DRP84_08085 [Spirochaetota bacterium]
MLEKKSQSDIKVNNLNLVLKTIIKNEPLSRADIVRLTKISKPTVSNLIDELIQRNLISEIGIGKSSGGRKPILLKFNNTKNFFLAFEMGRGGYRIAVSDLKGKILHKSSSEFSPNITLKEKLEEIKKSIIELLKRANISTNLITKSICLTPGIYVEKDKELKLLPYNGKNEHYDIKEYFKSFLKQDLYLGHATKLSLLGEKIAGKARGHKNVIYIDFAYGLGTSIMIDGKLYYGSFNSAGEIGYFYSSIEEFRNNDIKPYEFGTLEKHISGKSIAEKGKESAIKKPESKILSLTDGNIDRITAKTVFQAAKMGDISAILILKESFDYFNMALSNLINLLSPELIILGGGFSKSGDFLLNLIKGEIHDKVLFTPEIVLSTLQEDASIIGGIHYLIEKTDFLKEL